jgi:hypothetical protein
MTPVRTDVRAVMPDADAVAEMDAAADVHAATEMDAASAHAGHSHAAAATHAVHSHAATAAAEAAGIGLSGRDEGRGAEGGDRCERERCVADLAEHVSLLGSL